MKINVSGPDAPSAHDVVLEVNDRGPGIPEAEIKDIFRPFYRLVRAGSVETDGFGVGLAIAERVIKLHPVEGSQSKGRSHGSMFLSTPLRGFDATQVKWN